MPVPTQNNFVSYIESRAAQPQDYICFLDAETGETTTYFEVRLRSVWLARELDAQQVQRGGICALDMENSSAFIYALFAAAYGGFSVVVLSPHLSEEEKLDRIDEVKHALGTNHIPILDEEITLALVRGADSAPEAERNLLAAWARRGVAAFDDAALAVVAFSKSAHARTRAIPYSWQQLVGAALASNALLHTEGEGVWQMVLPASSTEGLSVVLRSVLNKTAFVLYRTFNAQRLLSDAQTYGATHVSLTSKMLQDLLDVAAETPAAPEGAAAPVADGTLPDSATPSTGVEAAADPATNAGVAGFAGATAPEGVTDATTSSFPYEYVLCCGAQPSQALLERALAQHVPVYATFGMPETTAFVACTLVGTSSEVLLQPLAGYETTIVAPDESGFGQLGVRGPGVLTEYLNVQAPFTVDNFFLTGEIAREKEGGIELQPKADAPFLSGGENVFPEEIREKVLTIEGTSEAYVFPVQHSSLEHKAVAFVEAAPAASRAGFNSFFFADDMRNRLSTRISPMYLPEHFVVMPEFPRTNAGKVSTGTLERMWDTRLQAARIELWHIRVPFAAPVQTAKNKMKHRESVIVRITDHAGRTGIGESVAFATDWYAPETTKQDLLLMRSTLAPLLLGRVLLNPGQVGELFENTPDAAQAPFACAAFEMALWDLYGKIRGRSIRQLIGARESAAEAGALDELLPGSAPGGAVVGIGSATEILGRVGALAEEGYTRVKLKIKPGQDVDIVRKVCSAYPQLMVVLDADQSYKDTQLNVLKQLDDAGAAAIEEPLDPSFVPTVGPTNIFDRLARLQTNLRMRVCLDESWTTPARLYEALEAHPELRCVSLKIAKFGGVARALEFYRWARERGIELWPGGMYETGISKRLHAAFALLPGVNMPGDLQDAEHYFTVDITTPPLVLAGGALSINSGKYMAGIGCELNEQVLANVSEGYWEIK